MLDLILWGFLILTTWIILLSCTSDGVYERAKAHGIAILTVSGKIRFPNKIGMDYNADTLFKKNDTFFPTAVEYDFDTLKDFGYKTVKFLCAGEHVYFEGPELKDILYDAASEYKFASVHGPTKVQPLWRSAIENETWIVALKRNGRGLTSGEFGPLLLINHPGGHAVVPEDRSKWVTGVYHIETK